jgi:2-desacetyl-2-hydroxyethyl bacteriochlorophyllide A dehydrogenase
MKMKGFVLSGKQQVELKEFDIGECGDDQVIIKNRVASVCGSDIFAFNNGGDNQRPIGSEFGHEMVSDIIAVGKDVTDLQVGQRVYPFPLTAKANSRRAGSLGGFSELVVVEKAKKNYNLYPVDDAITDKEAALIEPFTVGFRAAQMAQGKPGQNALVFGAGCVALSAAISLKYSGLDKVMIVDRAPMRLEIGSKLGFEVVDSSDKNWKQKVVDYFGVTQGPFGPGPQCQILLDGIGSDELFKDIFSMAGLFSTIVVVGIHHSPLPVDLMRLTYSTMKIIGSGGYMPEDVPLVMEVMKSKKFDIESIVTHTFPHAKLAEAITLASKANDALKVQIDYRS